MRRGPTALARWTVIGFAAVELSGCSGSPESPPGSAGAGAGTTSTGGVVGEAGRGGTGGATAGGTTGTGGTAGKTASGGLGAAAGFASGGGPGAAGAASGGAGATATGGAAGATATGGAAGAAAAGTGGEAAGSAVGGQAGSGGLAGSGGAAGGQAGTGGSGGDPSGNPIVDLLGSGDLSGWTIATGWPSGVSTPPLGQAEAEAIFPIDEDGTLHVYRDADDGSEQPRATLMTEASYGNYKLWVEYRWGEKKFAPYADDPRDAGILFHVTGDRDLIWPSSIEFQILEGQTGDLWVLTARCTSLALDGGNVFVDEADGGTPKSFDGTSGGYKQHQRSAPYDSLTDWNVLELTVTEDSAVYVVNGQMVNKVFDIQDRNGETVTAGPIALQAEYSEILYRNVRLQELP